MFPLYYPHFHLFPQTCWVGYTRFPSVCHVSVTVSRPFSYLTLLSLSHFKEVSFYFVFLKTSSSLTCFIHGIYQHTDHRIIILLLQVSSMWKPSSINCHSGGQVLTQQFSSLFFVSNNIFLKRFQAKFIFRKTIQK